MGFKSDFAQLFTTHLTAPQRNRFINAWGMTYRATINGQPNPQTKADYAVDQMIKALREKVATEESLAARNAVVVSEPPTL